jgi:hypothetical protein
MVDPPQPPFGAQIPRAGVRAHPSAQHGGVIALVQGYPVETVVASDGTVRVYVSYSSGEAALPGSVRGVVYQLAPDGHRVPLVLLPDRSTRGAIAFGPAPRGPFTEYELDLEFHGRSLRSGLKVPAGGTEAALAMESSQSISNDRAIGGGPAPQPASR